MDCRVGGGVDVREGWWRICELVEGWVDGWMSELANE
jgi:hypothetical protein